MVYAYPIFCLLCLCSLLFFTAAHFHPAGRQHFSLETLSKDWRRLGGGQPEVKFPALELISIITSSVARVHSQWRRRER